MNVLKFEKIVEDLLIQHNLKIYNSSLQDISNKLNIDLYFLYSPCRALKDNYNSSSKGIIILNKDLNYIEQRVAFFHEITHILLKHLEYCDSLTNSELKFLEKQTCNLSLILAMPKYEILNLNIINFCQPIDTTISEISELYSMPRKLVETRLNQIKAST